MSEPRVSAETIHRILTTDGLQPDVPWALDLRDARQRIAALETENERLRRFVREVLYDYLEIDKSSQCPWCLWIPGRSWQPIHECSAIEMIQAVGLRSLLPEARDEVS